MFALSILKIALVAAALTQGTFATTYAQFCDDSNCSENCGESVSVDNPGCLNEAGRHSVKFHDTNVQNVNLVYSPSPNCPCQNYCAENLLDGGTFLYDTDGGCYQLEDVFAESFRFVGNAGNYSPCGSNNC